MQQTENNNESLVLIHAVAALGRQKFWSGRNGAEVGDDRVDGKKLVPAGAGLGKDQVIQDHLSHSHEHFGVELAVVSPAGELQKSATVAGLELERLVELGMQCALLGLGFALLGACGSVEQIQLQVDIHCKWERWRH